MWPFKRRRAEEKLRAEATQRLADEVVDELVRNPRPPRIGLFPAQVRFILLQVRDEPVEHAAATIAKAIDLIERRNGTVTDVMSSMVLAVFGLPESDDAEKDRDQQAKTVARLVAELGAGGAAGAWRGGRAGRHIRGAAAHALRPAAAWLPALSRYAVGARVRPIRRDRRALNSAT